jgi:zinc protease
VRQYRIIFLIACFLTVGLKTASASGPGAGKHVLDNGMVVLIREMPASSVISIDALVRAGSATEGEYLGSGISHFVEHMLFKGTEKRAAGQISKEVRALGGRINAATGFDHTVYTIDTPEGTFDEALDIISDMLMNSTFASEEVQKEQLVIFSEMRLYYDNPDRQLNRLIFETVYLRHPYRHPIIGYEPLFGTLTREDLYDYYRSRYVPNNMIFSVAGPVEAPVALAKIREAFQNFKPRPYSLRNLPVEPPQISPRRTQRSYPTELTRMSLAYQGVSVLNQDMYALDVLAMILGQGESSRLYKEIFKNRGLVRAISASNYTPMDQGLFEVNSVLDEEKVDETIAAVEEQIALLKKKGVTASELEKAKRQVLSGYIFSNQTSSAVSHAMVINEAFVGDFEFSKKYVDQIKEVSNDDIRRVADRYLLENNLTVAVLKPETTTETIGSERQETEEPVIEKIVLDNGLTVLLREDYRFPLVSLRLAINGGTRAETKAFNGISNLVSQAWIKGTRRRSAEDIAESVESRGGSLDGFSGRQSMGLSLELLSEDLGFGIELLADLIKNPTFPDDEIGKAKTRTKAAILAQQDRITAVTAKLLNETLFSVNSFALDPLGTLESVERITRKEMIEFYQGLAVPNGMVLSVFGSFQAGDILPAIKKHFSFLHPKRLVLSPQKDTPPQEMLEKTQVLNKNQAMVMIGFQGPEMAGEEKYGVEVLSAVLGESMSGRIFMRIRDELGKAYTLGGSFRPGIGTGLIAFYVLTTDEHVQRVKEVLLEQIQQVREENVSDRELQDTKAYLKGTHLMALETNSSLGFTSALDSLYGLGFDHYQEHNAAIDRVSKEDVRRLAQKYLDPRNAVVVISRSKPPQPGTP